MVDTHSKAVDLVRKRLWSHGYSARVRSGEGFDLLANGRRIIVAHIRTPTAAGKVPFPSGRDLCAIVLFGTFGTPVIGYIDSMGVVYKRPALALGVPLKNKVIKHGKGKKGKGKKGACSKA